MKRFDEDDLNKGPISSPIGRIAFELKDVSNADIKHHTAKKATKELPISIKEVNNPSNSETTIVFNQNRVNYEDCIKFADSLPDGSDYMNKGLITSCIPNGMIKKGMISQPESNLTPRTAIVINNNQKEGKITREDVEETFSDLLPVLSVSETTKTITIETQVLLYSIGEMAMDTLDISPDNITITANTINEPNTMKNQKL